MGTAEPVPGSLRNNRHHRRTVELAARAVLGPAQGIAKLCRRIHVWSERTAGFAGPRAERAVEVLCEESCAAVVQ